MNYPCKYDIKVSDSEYDSAGANLKKYGDILNDAISQYILCLSNIAYNAVPSGSVHDAIVCFVAHLAPIENIASENGATIERISTEYYESVDKKDLYLYELGGSFTRDFSSAEFQKLLKMLKDDIWHNSFDYDWLKSGGWTIGGWFGGVRWDDVTDPKINIDDCHRNLLDYKDAEKSTIKNIFRSVQGVEDKYKPKFKSCYTELEKIKHYLDESAAIIDPAKGNFTVENIMTKLGPLLQDILAYHDEMLAVCQNEKDLSIGQIEDFVSQPWADRYFGDLTFLFGEFQGQIGDIDTFMYALFNHYNVDKELVKEFIKNGKWDQDAYEKYMTKSELMDMLDDMAQTYQYSGSEQQKIADDCSLFISYVKKYGEKWYEALNEAHLLDGRTKEAKEFRGFLAKLGGITTLLSIGDKAINAIIKCFTNYSLNNVILKAFIENSSSNPIMLESAKEIKSLYEDKMNMIISEAKGLIVDIGVDAGLVALSEKIGPMKIVGLIEEGIKITGDISGLGEKYKNMMNAFTYINIFHSSQEAYRNALEKVRDADKNSKNYPVLIQQLKDCFELTKNSAVKAFKAMAGYSDGDARTYYEYCAGVVEDASMYTRTNKGPLNIMSYDEWSKL